MSEYSSFFTRPFKTLSKTEINEYMVSIAPFETDVEKMQYQELFSNCFDHHVKSNVDAESDTFILNETGKRKMIFTDNLTSVFLERFYIKPSLFMTDSSDEETKDDQRVDYNYFMETVTDQPISVKSFDRHEIGSNYVSYLIGNVGEGKSILVAKMIKDIRKKNKSLKNNDFLLIPIIFDLEETGFVGEKGRLKDIDDSFYGELFYRIQDTIQSTEIYDNKAELLKHLPNPDNETDSKYCIKSLSAHLAKRNIRLILIFDNIDRYHFYNSKYSFFKKYNDDQRDSVENNINKLINQFSLKNYVLGNSGLCVLFVCRKYVYQCLRNICGTTTTVDRSRVFQLAPVSSVQVVNQRFTLFKEALIFLRGKIPKKFTNLEEGLQSLNALFAIIEADDRKQHFKEPVLDTIREISHHGYRGLIDFISSLKLNYKDDDIIKRLLGQQFVALVILYINQVTKRYTQDNNHFPNMFLNDCKILEDPNFPLAHKPHMHTYWLKYFLLKYITQKGRVSTEEIVSLFVGEKKYEEHLVLLVLGSLCTTNEFNCVEIDYTSLQSGSMKYILSPTKRGAYIVSPHDKLFSVHSNHKNKIDFCFRLVYLELVIDDYLLSFPKPFINNIYIEDNYRHLFMKKDQYVHKSLQHIKVKSKAVLHFTNVLFAALKVEIKRKEEVFRDLSNMGLIPDRDAIISSLRYELLQLCKKTNISSFYDHEITVLRNSLPEHRYLEFFNDYFESGVMID